MAGGKASENKLSDLHGILASEFIRRIKNGEASPSDLNAARQFLKDNSISCDGEQNPYMQDLMRDMPDLDSIEQ